MRTVKFSLATNPTLSSSFARLSLTGGLFSNLSCFQSADECFLRATFGARLRNKILTDRSEF